MHAFLVLTGTNLTPSQCPQLTRVLLERLMVNRPHPWGLLVTFIELIKNPVYKFWDHEFTQTSEEIRRLFANVAQHMGSAPRPVPA